jgi:hypothetical protein
MSSATTSVKIIPGHRDHRSGDRDKLITITPESVITFRRNPDHDHPGIVDHHRPESPTITAFTCCGYRVQCSISY